MKKNILITGFTSDIGIAIIDLLKKDENIIFYLVARDQDKIDLFLNQNYKNIKTYDVDVTDEEQVKDLFAKFKLEQIKFESIITLVGEHLVKPLRITKKIDYLRLFNSNFISVTNIVSSGRSFMVSGGSIVLIGTAAISRGSELVSAYVASKSALCGYVRSAALEFSDILVRVNCIHPGVVVTAASNVFINKIGEQAKIELIKRHPLGLGNSNDIASSVSFLISDGSRWITGQSIFVDGGFSISS
jgi:NAD(P)-dependent dehydrogenase (short-subunit alcohol dehydrogenase family)